jgi:hypothetical protein
MPEVIASENRHCREELRHHGTSGILLASSLFLPQVARHRHQ